MLSLIGLHPGTALWLFGSLARGEWDAYSDVECPSRSALAGGADPLADAVLSAGLANNALALRKKNGNNSDTAVIFTGGFVSERLSNAARSDSQ